MHLSAGYFLAQLPVGPCTCASVRAACTSLGPSLAGHTLQSQGAAPETITSHICTGYCATVINGAVHSKYTEENQLTHSASQTVKKLLTVKVPVLGYYKRSSKKYKTDTLIFCGYRL